MSDPDYDHPHFQSVGSMDTPEALHWDELWHALDQRRWDPALPDKPQFLGSLRQMSSLLAQDKLFWKLSAKHVFININRYYRDYVLDPWREGGEDFDIKQSEIYDEHSDFDFGWLARLLLTSILEPVAALNREGKTDPSENDLSRFEDFKRLADEANDLLSFSLFIERARKQFPDDEVIERVNVKRFIDEMIAILEDPERDPGKPNPYPSWSWLSATLRGAVEFGDTTMW